MQSRVIRTAQDETTHVTEGTATALVSKSIGKFKPAVMPSPAQTAPLHLDPFEIKDLVITTETTLKTFFPIVNDGKQGITWTISEIAPTYAKIIIQNELALSRDITIYWA